MKFLLRKINYRCDAAKALIPVIGVSRYSPPDAAFDWSVHTTPASFLLDKQPLLSGWYMLEVIMTASEQYLDCTLTVDYDDGSKRHHTFMVINQRIMKRVLLLKSGFQRITLTPSEKAVSFSISKMSFVKLTTRAAYKLMHKKLLTYKPGHDYTRSLHLWRHYEILYRLQHKSETDYQDWINRREFNELKRAFHLTAKGKFCFLIDTTNNLDIKPLIQSLDSILKQTYPLWDIIIFIPCLPENRLSELTRNIAHIQNLTLVDLSNPPETIFRKIQNITDASYFITLEPGTLLSPHAASVFARHLGDHQKSDTMYSDHDTVSKLGKRHSPHLKPDWSPDLMLSTDYIGSTIAFRLKLLQAGDSGEFYSLICWIYKILVTKAYHDDEQPIHIPQILYHLPTTQLTKKSPIHKKKLSNLNNIFRNTAITASATNKEGIYRVQWPLPAKPPLISIIIPTKDNLPTLKRALDSINTRTDYTNYEIIVVNNQSKRPETLSYFRDLSLHQNKRVLDFDRPFNYSAINNYAVQQAKGSYILLLNNDVEVINEDWLSELVSHAHRDNIGCVGAKLFYPDGRIQHGGVIVGLSGCAGHSHKFYPGDADGYMQRLVCTQNYSAVTAACLLVKKELYLAAGGLNETSLSVAFNDVDFCLKVQALGYRNVWTPWAKLYHYESLTRGKDDTTSKRKRLTNEVQYMKRTWSTTAYEDPYYNKHLTILREDFSLGF